MRGNSKEQLAYLFQRQNGKCYICGKPAVLDDNAVRFRIGSSFGAPNRVRPKVMAHRACAQERSDQIQMSQPIEDTWRRSRREPTVFYEKKDV